MIVTDITETEQQILDNAGLTVFKHRVIGPITDVEPTHPILKAYLDYSKYTQTMFVLYVRDDSWLMHRLKDSKSDLLKGNLFVVTDKTHATYQHVIDMLDEIGDLDELFMRDWEKVAVYDSVKPGSIPRLENRFVYDYDSESYQVKVDGEFYSANVYFIEHMSKGGLFCSMIADIPHLYTSSRPTLEEVTEHTLKYVRGKGC